MNASLLAIRKSTASIALRRNITNTYRRSLSSSDDKNSLVIPENPYTKEQCTPEGDFEKSPPELYAKKLSEIDPNVVFTSSTLPDKPVDFPDNASELTALDPAHSTWDQGRNVVTNSR
eukprot:CAMPEP_0194427598 /NCGR_PEP_ID=MMETSP0176-20130528/37462_1 /TAXON_ID=216777 /ORGANISM="Proboscia alata, Strain PI-D3" /LENGTH=117 /DNA_ID=CAMNT_0039239435 /DNA_START=36 /DNA_END=386 /DNA_ORIENTATION=-